MTNLVTALYNEFVELDLLDDRREYCVEDFQSSYDLSETDATALYELVQGKVTVSAKPTLAQHTVDVGFKTNAYFKSITPGKPARWFVSMTVWANSRDEAVAYVVGQVDKFADKVTHTEVR